MKDLIDEMAGFVFHVEFGMNETLLTRALEEGNWALAEHHMINSPTASYLDDGNSNIVCDICPQLIS